MQLHRLVLITIEVKHQNGLIFQVRWSCLIRGVASPVFGKIWQNHSWWISFMREHLTGQKFQFIWICRERAYIFKIGPNSECGSTETTTWGIRITLYLSQKESILRVFFKNKNQPRFLLLHHYIENFVFFVRTDKLILCIRFCFDKLVKVKGKPIDDLKNHVLKYGMFHWNCW